MKMLVKDLKLILNEETTVIDEMEKWEIHGIVQLHVFLSCRLSKYFICLMTSVFIYKDAHIAYSALLTMTNGALIVFLEIK